MVVAGFSAYTDVSRAHEVANEVRRVGKQLKESQAMVLLYNNRERLFNLPVTNVRAVFSSNKHDTWDCMFWWPEFSCASTS